MASSTSIRASCVTCGDKSVGIFKCEGCSHIFCRKHVNEHRNILSHQLDEIILEHDTLQQAIIEQNGEKNVRYSLLKQIDQWKKDSIMKIQRTAIEVREQIEQLTFLQKDEVSKELDDLAQRLRKARIDDDYIETDLYGWSTVLEKLKNDMNTMSHPIATYEDSTKLIGRLYITTVEERFGESFGDIYIEENGKTVIHNDSNTGDAFVRGTCEYSLGKHKIRFIIKRENALYHLLFGIISKSRSIPQNEAEAAESIYGWQSNDDTIPRTPKKPVSQNFRIMKNQKIFEIELLLDCDNQKISYFNQQTKNMREMNIDIKTCPFPWQLLFYLFDIDDCIQLISTNSHNHE